MKKLILRILIGGALAIGTITVTAGGVLAAPGTSPGRG
jgi:hypothetical protein